MSLSSARHGVDLLVHPTFRGDPGRMRRSARSARPRLSSDFSQQLHHRAGIPHLGPQQHGRRELETLLGGQAARLLHVRHLPRIQWLLWLSVQDRNKLDATTDEFARRDHPVRFSNELVDSLQKNTFVGHPAIAAQETMSRR